tara:strand:+ start:31 stop:591 length:561 start_codon:yes stop_codon:yes gene_type:complete
MQHPKIIISVATIILLFSCDTQEKITTYKIKKPQSVHNIKKPQSVQLTLKWTTPSTWEELVPGNMLMANFHVIDSKNKSVNISVSMFPGDVGGIENNANRWRRQINLQPQKMEEISKYIQNITLPLLGDAQFLELNNSQNNQGMKVLIVPNQNNHTIFVKMMGEADSLSELDYEFNLFVQSIYWGE